MSEGTGGVSIN